ncbi:MAG TPA: hypothetical protein VFC09_09640 [Candidatus Dormibacteraeota bacterium]|nr:hypothetical protein [Candidatus Dormibacteraeota bacterium]
MWVRGSRLRVPPARIDSAISNFTDETVPKLKSIPGNAGAVLLVERQQGVALALTYWKDRAALDASETQATGLRAGVADTVGATIEDVQRLEVMVMERQGNPEPGKIVRGIQFALDAGKVDKGVAHLRDTVTPELRRQKGFRAVICAVDRQQSRGVVSTVWDTRDDEAATNTSLAQLRKDALDRFGASQVDVQVMESVYVDIQVSALT